MGVETQNLTLKLRPKWQQIEQNFVLRGIGTSWVDWLSICENLDPLTLLTALNLSTPATLVPQFVGFSCTGMGRSKMMKLVKVINVHMQ